MQLRSNILRLYQVFDLPIACLLVTELVLISEEMRIYFAQRGWSLLGMMCGQMAIVQPNQSTASWNPCLFLGLQEMSPHSWDSWFFYAAGIPWFEERIAPLRELAKLDMQSNIEPLMKEEHFKPQEDLIVAILSDPCLARFDYKMLPYLLTDFSKKGFGYSLWQSADDDASMAAMRRKIEGGDC